jgi:hypothetical protein
MFRLRGGARRLRGGLRGRPFVTAAVVSFAYFAGMAIAAAVRPRLMVWFRANLIFEVALCILCGAASAVVSERRASAREKPPKPNGDKV